MGRVPDSDHIMQMSPPIIQGNALWDDYRIAKSSRWLCSLLLFSVSFTWIILWNANQTIYH